MTERTCDLGEVARLVGDAGAQRQPALVAISGFAGSGMTTLAQRLQARVPGLVVLSIDLLDTTDPLRMTDTWAATQRQVLQDQLPPSPVAMVEGRGLLHPEVARLFQLRVWLDVTLEEATMRGNLKRYQESRRDGGPLGQWVAEEPPERVSVDPAESEFFARFRPDRTADVLFVPIATMATPTRLRFMTEVGCDFVLWDDDNGHLGELEHLLPIPDDLRQRIVRHAAEWFLHDGGEPAPDWPGIEEFDRRGYLLSQELQEALGHDYRVDYIFNTPQVRRWAAQRR